MSRLDNMRIQGVVAVVAADSVLPIVDVCMFVSSSSGCLRMLTVIGHV
jgi:hypothetical protein